MTLAIGVDVAARRGCDIVALSDDGIAEPIGRVHTGGALTELLAEHRPDVVAIDSPPRWAAPDKRRDCERELTTRGICLFTTPNEARGVGHSFYGWMTVGFEMFLATDPYPSLETFPHAVAVAIRGCLPALGVTRRTRLKREWRLDALRQVEIDVARLQNGDEIDAALCAYTGLMWSQGLTVSVGDEREGRITLPVKSLLERYVR